MGVSPAECSADEREGLSKPLTTKRMERYERLGKRNIGVFDT